MIEAYDPEHRATAPLQKPSHYHRDVLELARQIEENGERILNPRDVGIRSIFLADSDWCADLNLHRAWIRYRYDAKRKSN